MQGHCRWVTLLDTQTCTASSISYLLLSYLYLSLVTNGCDIGGHGDQITVPGVCGLRGCRHLESNESGLKLTSIFLLKKNLFFRMAGT